MRGLSYRFFLSATLYALAGMFLGIAMAVLEKREILAVVGSFLTLASMLVIAGTVIRAGFSGRSARRTGAAGLANQWA